MSAARGERETHRHFPHSSRKSLHAQVGRTPSLAPPMKHRPNLKIAPVKKVVETLTMHVGKMLPAAGLEGRGKAVWHVVNPKSGNVKTADHITILVLVGQQRRIKNPGGGGMTKPNLRDMESLCPPRALRLMTIEDRTFQNRIASLIGWRTFSASTESLPFSWFLNHRNVFAYKGVNGNAWFIRKSSVS